MDLTHTMAYPFLINLDPQGQCVDEHPQGALCPIASLHPAQAPGTKDHALLPPGL